MPASRRFAIAAFALALCAAGIGFPRLARAQTEKPSPYQIHVESNQLQAAIRAESNLVVIQAYVANEKHVERGPTPDQEHCWKESARTLRDLSPREPFHRPNCDDFSIRGLTKKDFRLLVDGREQTIQKVVSGVQGSVSRDNLGMHSDWSETPAAFWSTSDVVLAGIPGRHIYSIMFIPAPAEAAGCHKVKVRVDRRHAAVYALKEYCSSQSPRDILAGTAFGREMAQDLRSVQPAQIPLVLQAGYFYASSGPVRVQVALQFPWEMVHRWIARDWKFHAKVGALGALSDEAGRRAARFGDLGCCTGDHSIIGFGFGGVVQTPDLVSDPDFKVEMGLLRAQDVAHIPTRYEGQIEVPPGSYRLKVVLSDGEKFGRVEVPLDIPAWDGKTLALSSVMLCKRFRDAHVAEVERKAANFAPQYVPLVSKNIEVTPAGDTRFKRKTKVPLIAYFEVYEPLLTKQPATNVEAHIRILNTKTGQLVKDFPPVDAREYETPGSWKIPIARKVPFEEFPKGAYRLEVQATDSAGRSTTWQTADFTVE